MPGDVRRRHGLQEHPHVDRVVFTAACVRTRQMGECRLGPWAGTREFLALKADRSSTCEDVVDALAELFAMRGILRCIRTDIPCANPTSPAVKQN